MCFFSGGAPTQKRTLKGAFAFRNFAYGEYISPFTMPRERTSLRKADMRTGFRFASLAEPYLFCGGAPTQKRTLKGAFALEAPPGIEPGIEVLQTFALPLGHSALFNFQSNGLLNLDAEVVISVSSAYFVRQRRRARLKTHIK